MRKARDTVSRGECRQGEGPAGMKAGQWARQTGGETWQLVGCVGRDHSWARRAPSESFLGKGTLTFQQCQEPALLPLFPIPHTLQNRKRKKSHTKLNTCTQDSTRRNNSKATCPTTEPSPSLLSESPGPEASPPRALGREGQTLNAQIKV